MISESTVICGLGPLEAVARHQRVVVVDVPVVDPDDGAVPDGVVVGRDAGVALCVVAHVEEHLAGVGRDRDVLEHGAGAATLLVHTIEPLRRAVRIADGVGAALGDRGEQGLSGASPIDARYEG